LPFTPGLEVCGVVRALGEGVDAPAAGTRVMAAAALPNGGLAEHALASAADAWPVPDSMDDATAAAMIIAYQTAWFGLFHRAELQPGETLVVHAGASGVGSAAIQLGVHSGARVIATAGGPDKVAVCKQLGAHVVIDYRNVDLVDALRDATAGNGADVIYDPVGGDVFDASRRCLTFEGRLVVVGFASGRIPEIPANHVLVKNYTVLGLHWGAYRRRDPALVQRCHDELMRLHAEGAVQPLLMPSRPLTDAPDALMAIADRGAVGKLVLTV
jgi:NADPH2:quinone reductase